MFGDYHLNLAFWIDIDWVRMSLRKRPAPCRFILTEARLHNADDRDSTKIMRKRAWADPGK